MVPGNTEELSGIDNESYVIINEEQVVDGVANFIAKCIVSNPKSKRLTPEELHKTVVRALGSMNEWEKMRKVWHAGKLIYALSTWGFAFAGLYRHRAVLKVVAKGVGASSKAVMKAF
ncbi:elongation factor [Tasmannia lanceolata]|uniref:elongation factor n=1 Tax=Tasmannia lanceolata TaxID=3420 RepID=UPI0040648B1B